MMHADPMEIRSRAIETTLAQFDFERVQSVISLVGINLNTRAHQAGCPPTVDEMKTIARELLERAWDDEDALNCEYCHGGLRALRTGECLTLQFVVEESYFVTAVDLRAA